MKKLLLALFILLPLQAHAYDPCVDDAAKYKPISERYTKGLFFTVKKCGVEVNYLLGTMHSDDPKILSMLGYVFSKLAYAKSASFELVFDPVAIKKTMASMNLPADSIDTLQSIIGISTYSRLNQIMQKNQPNQPESSYYRMKPWAMAVMLQEPPNQSDGIALDIRLQQFAKQRNIPVYGLETVDDQMRVFDTIPQDKQVEFLKDTIDNYAQIDSDNKQMSDIYLAQDLNKLQELGDKSFDTISDREFADKLKIDLVDKRNRKMVRAMQDKLDAGGAFIAIGALHLTGKEGILKQLEDKGYFIDVVEDSSNKLK